MNHRRLIMSLLLLGLACGLVLVNEYGNSYFEGKWSVRDMHDFGELGGC